MHAMFSLSEGATDLRRRRGGGCRLHHRAAPRAGPRLHRPLRQAQHRVHRVRRQRPLRHRWRGEREHLRPVRRGLGHGAGCVPALPQSQAVQRLPRDARQGRQEHRCGHGVGPRPFARRRRHAGDEAWQARVRSEAAGAHPRRSARVGGGREEVQGPDTEGQPGPPAQRHYNGGCGPFKWGGGWDFGTGTLGDMACHIMDAAFWTLDLGYPTRIEPESAPLLKETAPAGLRITYYFAAKGNRPELKVTWADNSLYPARPPELADDAAWPPDTGGGQLWIGTAGKLVAGTYGDDPTLLDAARQADVTAHPPAQKYPRSKGHYAEWIAACKGGPPANSAFATYSGAFTEMVMLGCLAVRLGPTLEVNPATGQIPNLQVPAGPLTPPFPHRTP